MFEERSKHHRNLAARLRDMAAATHFPDLRGGYLELAARFDRLADRAERPRPAHLPGAAVHIAQRYRAKPEA